MYQKNNILLGLFESVSNSFLVGEIVQQTLIFVFTLVVALSISKSLSAINLYCENTGPSKSFYDLKQKESLGEKLMYSFEACRKRA